MIGLIKLLAGTMIGYAAIKTMAGLDPTALLVIVACIGLLLVIKGLRELLF